ncbi:MAG: polyphosphate kinase 2 [Sphingomonadales bacterium]|nr:polyphosphate kinase 2 [Sphingomonadales bacterium]
MAGSEIEIKLAASERMLEALRHHPALAGGADAAVTLSTRYFDTAGDALHRAGASLRLRVAGKTREQTFKRGAGCGLARSEWTAPAPGDQPDPGAFSARQRAEIAPLLAGAEPEAYALVTVERTKRRLRFGESLIEIAFDHGTITADGRSEAICEVELEIIAGRVVDGLRLALALPLGEELHWSIAAKGERGWRLARGKPTPALHAREVALTGAMDVAAGFRAVAWNCLFQLLGNYRLVIEAGDNDALHQSRVAIRRLRAALSLFAGGIDGAGAEQYRQAFAELAAAMGEAREMHVLLAALQAAGEGAPDEDGDDAGLVAEITARRAAGLQAAARALAAAGFQRLLFEFAVWVESVEPAPELSRALPRFAETVLDEHARRVAHAGRHLTTLSDHRLHRLRIRVKRLRYAVEFFTALAREHGRSESAEMFATRLARLQDRLGALHDLAERQAGAALFARYPPERAQRLHAALAERLGDGAARRKALMKQADQALARVLDLPRWWTSFADADETDGVYAGELRALQIRLTALQRRVIAEGRKLLIIFEGRDAAGKDGTIKHIVKHMSPRDTRVVALGVPSARESRGWYFQRWCSQLPVAGEIVLFNRSWYNRAGVEHVMGFCTTDEYEEFMASVGTFEQLLVDSGFTLLKYYLDISKAEQKQRIAEREHDPLKQWKISPIDRKAVRNWKKYSDARNAMLARTHSVFAPWVVVRADHKPPARLAVIRDILARCGEPGDDRELPDPTIVFAYDGAALDRGWLSG